MDRQPAHYHIHWSGKAGLDWECFDTSVDAEASASKLIRPDETYTIEEYGPDCTRCTGVLKAKSAHGPFFSL